MQGIWNTLTHARIYTCDSNWKACRVPGLSRKKESTPTSNLVTVLLCNAMSTREPVTEADTVPRMPLPEKVAPVALEATDNISSPAPDATVVPVIADDTCVRGRSR